MNAQQRYTIVQRTLVIHRLHQ